VQARHAVKGSQAIVQGEEDPEFYSYFIAHKDTGLTRSDSFPKGLEGMSFTFGSDGSTSGRLMPEYFIRKYTGKSPEEFFGRPNSYSGSHDKTAELVQSGSFQAGVLNYAVYDARVAKGDTDPEVCRVIWKSETYPDYNFTAHPVLEEWFGAGFTDKLQKALLEMTDKDLLQAFPRKRLIKASNADFKPIEELARQLEFIRG
jgi:phosphonate transport system substrate-binding protein